MNRRVLLSVVFTLVLCASTVRLAAAAGESSSGETVAKQTTSESVREGHGHGGLIALSVLNTLVLLAFGCLAGLALRATSHNKGEAPVTSKLAPPQPLEAGGDGARAAAMPQLNEALTELKSISLRLREIGSLETNVRAVCGMVIEQTGPVVQARYNRIHDDLRDCVMESVRSSIKRELMAEYQADAQQANEGLKARLSAIEDEAARTKRESGEREVALEPLRHENASMSARLIEADALNRALQERVDCALAEKAEAIRERDRLTSERQQGEENVRALEARVERLTSWVPEDSIIALRDAFEKAALPVGLPETRRVAMLVSAIAVLRQRGDSGDTRDQVRLLFEMLDRSLFADFQRDMAKLGAVRDALAPFLNEGPLKGFYRCQWPVPGEMLNDKYHVTFDDHGVRVRVAESAILLDENGGDVCARATVRTS